MTEEYLSVRQVCGLLNIHYNTAINWLKSGYLTGIRFGKTWRIPRSLIENREYGTVREKRERDDCPPDETASDYYGDQD